MHYQNSVYIDSLAFNIDISQIKNLRLALSSKPTSSSLWPHVNWVFSPRHGGLVRCRPIFCLSRKLSACWTTTFQNGNGANLWENYFGGNYHAIWDRRCGSKRKVTPATRNFGRGRVLGLTEFKIYWRFWSAVCGRWRIKTFHLHGQAFLFAACLPRYSNFKSPEMKKPSLSIAGNWVHSTTTKGWLWKQITPKILGCNPTKYKPFRLVVSMIS